MTTPFLLGHWTLVIGHYPLRVLLLVLALTLGPAALAQPAPAARAKVTLAGQPPATAPHQPILALPASGPVSATLTAQAFHFTPTSYTWSQVAPTSVQARHLHAAQATVTLSATSGAQITATFPSRGIYQIDLTATDGAQTAVHQVWVHVWDRLDGLNPLQQIGRNPGLLPPASVRQLSPDPGPFQHPRLLFTDADWPELNAKSTASTEVAGALARLQTRLNENFDKTSAPAGSLRTYANALLAWADGGYLDATYTGSVESVRVFSERKQVGMDPRNHLPDSLLVASYLVWVRNNPATPAAVSTSDQNRLRFLSRVAAAAARAELTRARLGLATSPVGAPDMAVVYDLLYDSMTVAERTDLRDYLYAIGYGFYNTGTGGLSRTVQTAYRSNGDFPNLVDPWILPALAIEGEESAVSPEVIAAHTPVLPPATGPGAWPHASPATFWNLHRMLRWYSEFFVTPWGSPLNHHAYFEASSGMSGPAMLALARRAQNGFVTTHLYQASYHVFNNLAPESPTTPPVLWDHHDGMGFGNGIGGYAGRYLARYLFPDDALMDYVYPTFRREISIDFYTALFHVDRPAKTMAQVAAEKGLSLTHFDPYRGAGTTRNTWGENDLSLYFECRPDVQGHMHAEANNFSLYALGRAWSTPPGYHITINEASATVLIQDPALASDPATEGYIGQSPSAATITPTRNQFPTPPGKVVEATDDPAGQWTLFAGDASSPYNYAFEGGQPSTLDTGRRNQDFFYGEVLSQMIPGYNPNTDTSTLRVGNLAYNPVAYAFRTVFTARGTRPYVLVIDDITTDGVTPRNFRWNMPALGRSALGTLRLQPGATATDGILFHTPDASSGPRLLVRDLSEQSTAGQPPIFLDRRVNGDGQPQLDIGYDNNSGLYTYVQSNRLLIPRQNVVSPKFKVLLFPHQSGENLPLTSWNANQTVASIDLRNGYTDRLTFDSTRPDKRTRLTAFTRTQAGRIAPTLNLPANLTVQASPATLAFTGQPGATVTFTVTATDDTGATLAPALSSPSGTVFPIGINPVHVTATDSRGQITSRSFTVTVVPAPPEVTVVSATNQPGFPGAISLRWPVVERATAYSVKRAATPGGPYTVVSDRQPATDLDFSEGGLTGATHFYVVTSWLDALEGTPSAAIPLSPALDTLQAAVVGTGLAASGVHGGGSRYLLTAANGNHGGGADGVTYASRPWTGDGTFTVRVASLSAVGVNVSEFLNLGLSLRASTAGNAITYFSGFTTFPHTSSYIQISRASTGQGATQTSYPVPPNPLRIRPVFWLRATRSGQTFSAAFSADGQTWSPTADPVTLANFPASFVAGVALGAHNSTVTDAVFDNFVFLGSPVPVVQPSAIALSWQASPGLTFTLSRATSPGGPFAPLATGLTATSYTDTAVTPGTTYYYQLSTPGTAAGGATTSASVARYFPLPVTAPTGLVLTPAIGQITLTWTAGDPATSPTYTVERATSAGGPFTVIATGLAAATYTDTGFNSGTSYFYRIVAGNGRNTATSTAASATSTAGPFTKTDNATALDLAGSWSPTARPGPADTLRWTGTYATTSAAAPIGTGLNVLGLHLQSPSTAITINAGTAPLTVGANGIDLSTATQNLTIHAPVALAANQTWNVASGRTLTFTGEVRNATSARALTLAGPGTVLSSLPFTHSGGTTLGAGTLSFDYATETSPFAGTLLATGGTLRANRAGGTLVLDATDLPSSSVLTGLTLAGASGAGFVFNPHPSASLTATINTAGLSFTQKAGAFRLTNNGGASRFRIEGGTFTALATDRFQLATAGQTFTVTGGTVDLTAGTESGLRIGSTNGAGGSGAQTVTFTQSGGTVLGPFLSIGGNDTTPTRSPSYTLSGGTLTLNNTGTGALLLGADTAGSGSSAFLFSGGKLTVPGTIAGNQTGARQIFAMSGGTLAVGAINATNLRSSDVAANGTFTQAGGTLAPGDTGPPGRTTITGNYALGAVATLALDLGGTTAATTFQGASNQFDTVTVSGATTLAGTLALNVAPAFTPNHASTFTVLTSTGTLSGAFSNVPFGSRLLIADGRGSFLVNRSGNTVTLSAYLPVVVTPVATQSASAITLAWNGSTASTYRVERGLSSTGPFTTLVNGLTATTYTDTAVTPGTAYFYRLTGTDSSSRVTTLAPLRAVATQITLTTPASVAVNTTNPAGTTVAFATQVTATDNFDGPLIVNLSPASGSSFPVGTTPITASVSNTSGQSVSRTFPVVVTLLLPATPAGLAVAPGFTTNTLTWNAATGAANYLVKRGPSASGPFTQIASLSSSVLTYTDSALVTGQTYFYVVSSLNATGESALSAAVAGTPTAGVALKANNASTLDLGASWTTATIPTTADFASWNGTYSGGANTVTIGGGLSVLGLRVLSPTAGITINAATGPLTLGAGGIDLSTATQNLTINAPVSLGAAQSWNVGNNVNRTVTVASAITAPSPATSLTKEGIGTVTFTSAGSLTLPGLLTVGGGALNLHGTSTLNGGFTQSTGTTSVTGALSAPGTLTITGGTFTASQSASLGALSVTGGTATFTGPVTTLGAVTLANATLNLGGTTATPANVPIPSFSLTASGTAVLNLNNTPNSTPYTVTLAAGSALGTLRPGAGDLTLTSPGAVTIGTYGLNNHSSWRTTFSGGTWTITTTGTNGGQNLGTTRFTGGTTATITSGRYAAHGTWELGGPSGPAAVTITTTALTGEFAPTGGFQLLLRNGATFVHTPAMALGLGQAITTTQTNRVLLEPGASARFGGNLTLGTTAAVGAGGAETDLVELTGGKLVVGGTLAAATAATGQTRRFEWTGGQLSAATITSSGGFTTPTTPGGLTATGLVQPAGTTLAPGDTGTAGRTTINGTYTQQAGATLDLDLGGTTQATAFQTGGYDLLAIAGTTTLGGPLSVRLLPGFTPSAATTFTVLNSTGALSGAFSNVPFGQPLVTTGGEGRFTVNQVGNTVTLTGYVAHTPQEIWRHLHFATIASTGPAADTADPDRDGAPNLLEYALATSPTSTTSVAQPDVRITNNGTRLSITFLRARADLTYLIEASSSLAPGSWTVITTNPGSVGQSVTVTDNIDLPAATPPRRFLRVRVTSP